MDPSTFQHLEAGAGSGSGASMGLDEGSRQRLQALLREGWKFTPATMAHKITRGQWIPARHLLYISTKVSTAIARGGARIILTMPARHGKSEFLSVNTPIWFLEHWPHKYVMNLTYALELATDFSLKVRDTFTNEENHALLSTRIRQDKRRVDRYLTTRGGGLTAAGIGGPITGRGADLMLIDDYIKNAEAALSETQLDTTWEWFRSTAYTRLEPGASLIILATRWAKRDLIGRVLEEMPHEGWEVINLPALAEENDPLEREIGEPLWPERYSAETLYKIKETVGPYWWRAMYQQDPMASMSGAELGNKLKVIPEKDLPHESHLTYGRYWDLAGSQDSGDWTVGAKMALHKETNKVYITDVIRFRKSPGGVKLMVRACAEGDGRGTRIKMEQEPGSAGKTVIEDYKSDVLPEYSFEGEKTTGDIEVRSRPFLAAVEAGRVYMVKAEWNDGLVHEINAFPDGEHDDQLTALALGYYDLVGGKKGGATWGRDILAEHDKIVSMERYRTRDGRKTGKRVARVGVTW